MSRVRKPGMLYFAALLLSGHALLFYGFPLAALVGVWLLFALWFLSAGGAQAMLVAVSLAVSTLVLNFAIHSTGLEQSIYYRPHELMKSYQQDFGEIFKPNTQFSMAARFGDIEALEKVGVMEPHEIAYRTDSLGFRNPADYHGQKVVLLGDSFVAGANDTQSCILSEWLRKDHGLDTYNLGFPGDLNDYVNRFDAFRRVTGGHARVLMFVYEGNDYRPFTHRPVEHLNPVERYYALFKNSGLWRYTRSLYLRGMKKSRMRPVPSVPVTSIDGKQPMAFFSEDRSLLERHVPWQESELRFGEAFQSLRPQLEAIFFVPVKYRVYAQWLTREVLPNEQWNYLAAAAERAGIPAHDLTPALQAEAARLLPQGQYVYWRDDTHWNCDGMRTAAIEVARVLETR